MEKACGRESAQALVIVHAFPSPDGQSLIIEVEDNGRGDIFEKYTVDYQFEQKSPRLANPYTINLPPGHLPSRSEAKKILAGAEAFTSIVMDFKSVESIGQGFADEIFRVFKAAHLEIEIELKNASTFIMRMIAHVQKG